MEHGVNGLLTEEWDETGFAAAITRILDDPARGTMARAARATAEAKFDNAKGLARVEDIIRATVQAR
ncbi:hypothetical protein ABFB10_00990 [Ponticoccus litoralis]|uniref:Glycosyl transferase family 1 domain-containing protein n=1 Tax=Ponticoccus litoralis TaxID=422297 RepID=A0AAW9SLZ3_9RHOB